MAIIRTQTVLDIATLVWDDTAMSATNKRVTDALDLLDVAQHAQQRPINEVAYSLDWTNDATVVGTFQIEVTNTPETPSSWVPKASLSINDEAGPNTLELATGFAFARLVYTNASGTGTLGVTTVCGKRSAGQVGAGGGDLEFVEEIEVTGSAVQDINFTGLDGDTDKFYLLTANVEHGDVPNAVEYSLEINGSAPTARTGGMIVSAASAVTGYSLGNLTYCGGCTQERISWRSEINAESGRDRHLVSDGTLYDDPLTNIQFSFRQTSVIDDDSNNISSIGVHADNASGIGVGSKFTLWRRKAG